MEMNYELDIREKNWNLQTWIVQLVVFFGQINYLNFQNCMCKIKFIVPICFAYEII